MLARLGKIALLLFQAVFLNIVVPGHTRGAITVAGYSQQARIAAGCCCCDTQSVPTSDGKRTPTPSDKAHCAICYFAAGLSTPEFYDYRLAELGPIDLLPFPPPESEPITYHAYAYPCRGPPSTSF